MTSFRATLEEVERAELLLHVRDASSPMMEEQKAEVEKVLRELDAAGKPVIEVMNKIDLVPPVTRDALAKEGRVLVSGLKGEGLEELLGAIDGALVLDPVIETDLRLPQSEGAIIAALEAGAVLREKRFEEIWFTWWRGGRPLSSIGIGDFRYRALDEKKRRN